MKTILLTVFLFIALQGYNQTLMLSERKAVVNAQMHFYPDYERTVRARNYLEFQKDSVAIGFRFDRDSLDTYYGRWICSEVALTMPLSREIQFLSKKIGCDCWCPKSPDSWLYRTDEFSEMVVVRRYYSDEAVTYVYGWED